MLLSHNPTKSLYHYCSTNSFVAILDSRSVWLSSLRLSSDSMEGRHVVKVLNSLVEHDEFSVEVKKGLLLTVGNIESQLDGLAFCLSEEGDLLSQWRGYADDGRGVAIGFSVEYLKLLEQLSRAELPRTFRVHKVEYEESRHADVIESTYSKLRPLLARGAFGTPWSAKDRELSELNGDANRLAVQLMLHFFELKSGAFAEEREWRLVSHIGMSNANDPCLMRSAAYRIIPYRKLDLIALDPPAISAVVLGPKHTTPKSVIQTSLKRCGFGDVEVRESKATYR